MDPKFANLKFFSYLTIPSLNFDGFKIPFCARVVIHNCAWSCTELPATEDPSPSPRTRSDRAEVGKSPSTAALLTGLGSRVGALCGALPGLRSYARGPGDAPPAPCDYEGASGPLVREPHAWRAPDEGEGGSGLPDQSPPVPPDRRSGDARGPAWGSAGASVGPLTPNLAGSAPAGESASCSAPGVSCCCIKS